MLAELLGIEITTSSLTGDECTATWPAMRCYVTNFAACYIDHTIMQHLSSLSYVDACKWLLCTHSWTISCDYLPAAETDLPL